jgi:N-methylhydantoinase B/oxoprolinase/acetone carboxylase alpha subunit
VKGKETLRLAEGDLVVIETCGGGGFGSPADRSPALRARDRLEGYVA